MDKPISKPTFTYLVQPGDLMVEFQSGHRTEDETDRYNAYRAVFKSRYLDQQGTHPARAYSAASPEELGRQVAEDSQSRSDLLSIVSSPFPHYEALVTGKGNSGRIRDCHDPVDNSILTKILDAYETAWNTKSPPLV